MLLEAGLFNGRYKLIFVVFHCYFTFTTYVTSTLNLRKQNMSTCWRAADSKVAAVQSIGPVDWRSLILAVNPLAAELLFF